MTQTYNACDGGHDTQGQIRRLPLSGGAAILVCHRCYLDEMVFRRHRNLELAADCRFDLPKWSDLKIVEPALR